MAKTETRYVTIHKPEKYDRFTQVGFANLGIAMGKLSKVGGKNLYLYLVSNKSDLDFELKVANYANWLGDPIFDENGNKNSKDSTYRSQVREGIKQLEDAGFLVEKYPNVYDFYEEGVVTNVDECNKSLHLEESVTDGINVDECDKMLHPEEKVVYLKQSLPNVTNSYECEDLLQNSKSIAELLGF